ncbi:MAG: AAA family ATPase [Planctomycetota bacterium]|nr:AAA family ATPase [Planctomycetota bacterium]
MATSILSECEVLEKGYFAAFGPPGSGKSTLATWLSDSHPELIVARYHAFHPERHTTYDRNSRIRADNFIVNLLEALRQSYPSHFRVVRPSQNSASQAADVLWEGLTSLSLERRVVVVVDGLDHAVRGRSQSVDTLLDALPPVSDMPSGVIFLLFGQPDWEYPHVVLQAPRYNIPPFTRLETERIILSVLPDLANDPSWEPVVARIQDSSGGNPLSVFYTVQSIRNCDSAEDALASLDSGPEIGPEVRAFYQQLWDDIEHSILRPLGGNFALIRDYLKAFLSVAQVPINASYLYRSFREEIPSEDLAGAFLLRLRPLLREVAPGQHWALYHDDFRMYLQETVREEYIEGAHRRHARAIAQITPVAQILPLALHLSDGRDYEGLSTLLADIQLGPLVLRNQGRDALQAIRLALCGALHESDCVSMLLNSLLYERCEQLVPSAFDDTPTLGLDRKRSLTEWNCLLPPAPEAADWQSISLRTRAVFQAATEWDEDPELALQVGRRFALPEEHLPDSLARLELSWVHYLEAWTKFCLRSGSLEPLRNVGMRDTSLRRVIGSALVEAVADLDSPVVARSWLLELPELTAEMSEDLLGAALTSADRRGFSTSEAILQTVWELSENPSARLRRKALFLSLRLDDTNRVDSAGALEAEFRLPGYPGDPWQEILETAAIHAYLGSTLDMSLLVTPASLLSAVIQNHGDRYIAATRFVWRLGTALGFLYRDPVLVRPESLVELLAQLVTGRIPGLHTRDSFLALTILEDVLPSLLDALRSPVTRPHYLRVKRRLRKLAIQVYSEPSTLPLLLFSAILEFDPNLVKRYLRRAFETRELPDSTAELRGQWFSFWVRAAGELEVECPAEFLDRQATARLGYSEHTPNPIDLIARILPRVEFASDAERTEVLREIFNVTCKLAREEAGPRAVRSGLHSLLAHSLCLSARDFYALTTASHEDPELAKWDGDLALSVMEALNDRLPTLLSGLTTADVTSIFHWLATSPGSLSADTTAAPILSTLVASLRTRGEDTLATLLESWSNAVLPNAVPDSARTIPADEQSEPTVAPQPLLESDLLDIRPSWLDSGWNPDMNSRLMRYLSSAGEAGFDTVYRCLARVLSSSASGDPVQASLLTSFIVREHSIDASQARQLLDALLSHTKALVSFQSENGPYSIQDPSGGEVSSAMVGLVSRLLNYSDVETVRRSIRSLHFMGGIPELRTGLVQALEPILRGDDARPAAFAVLSGSSIPENLFSPDTLDAMVNHDDAFVRWAWAVLRGRAATWQDSGGPALAIRSAVSTPSSEPDATQDGNLFWSTPASIREEAILWLRELTAQPDEMIREGISSLEARIESFHETIDHDSPRGHRLIANTVDNAVGGYARGLLPNLADDAVEALMAFLAPADPWLLTCSPIVPAPEEWISIGEFVESYGSTLERVTSCLGTVSQEQAVEFENTGPAMKARIAFQLLRPAVSRRYSWISTQRPRPVDPEHIAYGPCCPLVIGNHVLSALPRASFDLVPNVSLPELRNLSYSYYPIPQFSDESRGVVIQASYRESNSSTPNDVPGRHPAVSSATGWYASPDWLSGLTRETDKTLVRITRRWRSATSTQDATDEPAVAYEWEQIEN